MHLRVFRILMHLKLVPFGRDNTIVQVGRGLARDHQCHERKSALAHRVDQGQIGLVLKVSEDPEDETAIVIDALSLLDAPVFKYLSGFLDKMAL